MKAKELTKDLEIEKKIKTPRVIRKKKQFDYEANDEALVFNESLIDTGRVAMKEQV